MTFEEIGIENKYIRAIEELGFKNPMPVQEKVIPHLINNDSTDIIALAQTGTGKTAAFGLPLIQKTNTTVKHVQHLILCPTRELCLQISDDLNSYAKYDNDIKITAVFGGASIERQISIIKKGVHIISATPGRLLDLIKRGVVKISKIKTVVLDEADEMLNMGFRDELEAILSETPADKNTLLFSATMPNEVRKMASRFMNNPVEFTIGKKNVGAENVNHVSYMVHARDRYFALKRIVDFYPGVYGIVFCRTRKETQEVAEWLIQDGYNADSLHGDLSQPQRDKVMASFRIKHLKLLVATDVAARGLDVESLTHIINYNLPDDLEVYTHRSGRTGRAGRSGTSIVIANLKEKYKLQLIEKQINKKFENKTVPLGRDICEKQLFHLVDKMEKVEVDNEKIDSFLPAIMQKLEWMEREELIKKFVSIEFNRFLEYYKKTPDLNVPESQKKRGEQKSSRGRRDNAEFTRFFINLGNMDNLKPVDVIGMINDYTNNRDISIGEIDIRKNFSFFEADKSFTEAIMKGFKDKAFKKRSINLEVAEAKKHDEISDFGRNKKRSNFKKESAKPKEKRKRREKRY
ncbi:MAG: DEAD/DEAH box helicase [Bacteroidetes bacterium]|nr:DEAD/DEAH box helicase [Bacteroidota bacterium]MBU1680857.1 DEAD/DEAH box helicase [Bacteroidota bacterium]MBU2506910.1 DEAD/DEAH box helicase [Bacteroidota bacterium]